MRKTTLSQIENISALIRTIRGQKVILDADLARIFGVPTFRFNEAVKRNRARFPDDFLFQLTPEEYSVLISQIAISSSHGGQHPQQPASRAHECICSTRIRPNA